MRVCRVSWGKYHIYNRGNAVSTAPSNRFDEAKLKAADAWQKARGEKI